MKLCAFLLAAGVVFGQHSFTPSDIEDGGRLYRSTCVTCHGPNGDLVGGIDLFHAKFRRATTDDSINEIIRKGIAGTPMPPNNFTEFQAATIVAYLRSVASTGGAVSGLAGDAARGKTIVEGKGQCLTCHRVRGNGSRVGPDLTDVGALRRAPSLQRSLLEPDAEIQPANRYYRVVLRDGSTLTGRIMDIDTFAVRMLDSSERLRSFQKSELKEHGFVEKSPMPSYQGKLTPQEIADVVAYLGSLKGIEVQK